MKIENAMTGNPKSCGPATNLAEATALMWSADCGILPVVEDNGQVSGVITDRDMMIALGTRNVRPSELTVGDVMMRPALTVKPGDNLEFALALMAQQRIRRLPVVNDDGQLAGMISLNDIVLRADRKGAKDAAMLYDSVVTAMKSICGRALCKAAAA